MYSTYYYLKNVAIDRKIDSCFTGEESQAVYWWKRISEDLALPDSNIFTYFDSMYF